MIIQKATKDERLHVGDIVIVECDYWHGKSPMARITEIAVIKNDTEHCYVECYTSGGHTVWVEVEHIKTIDEYHYTNDFLERIRERLIFSAEKIIAPLL